MTSLRLITILFIAVCMAVSSASLHAQGNAMATDTISPRPGLIKRIFNYFDRSNQDRPDKKFDVTFLGGPSYSDATSFYLAVMAAGVYHTRRDSVTPTSEASVFAQASFTGFYRVGISGNHYSPSDKFRIVYDIDFAHFPLKFWGIGYADEHIKANETKYTELQSDFQADFTWRLPHDVFIGPTVNFHFSDATKVTRPELWQGQSLKIFNYGMGVVVSYDSRDYVTNASRGWNVRLEQKFFPRFFGNRYAFSSTELTLGWYKQFWKSGIWAFQAHGWSTYGDTPWCMMPTLDSSKAIRGYFEGRYRNKNEADIVVELRQHVWKRTGIVVWGGLGTVFNHPKEINIHTLLPSYGIGVRWELKKKVNLRVDFGVGKHSTGFMLGMHETF